MKASLALLLFAGIAQARQVAITIDDLPRGLDGGPNSYAAIQAMTQRLLAPIRAGKIPVTGFVNAGRTSLAPDELRRILSLWIGAGADLGNHTWSHAGLNSTPVEEYQQEILKNDAALRPILERKEARIFPVSVSANRTNSRNQARRSGFPCLARLPQRAGDVR